MRRGEQSSLILAAGLWVSLGLHIALGLGLARFSIAGISEGGRDTAAAARAGFTETYMPQT